MEVKRFQFKQLETQIKNLIKLLGLNLNRLHKHYANIKRLAAIKDWQELHKEQINTNHTIHQINANIEELHRLRRQINEEDLPQFDLRVQEIKEKSVTTVNEFYSLVKGEITGMEKMQTSNAKKSSVSSIEHGTGDISLDELNSSTPSTSNPSHDVTNPLDTRQDATHLANGAPPGRISPQRNESDESEQRIQYSGFAPLEIETQNSNQADIIPPPQEEECAQVQIQAQAPPDNVIAEWEEQREKIETINELTHLFAEEVFAQQEKIDCIEDNINNTQEHVSQGATMLGKANKYKAAMFPVIGAGVGLLVGGPIGFVAGLKLGGFAAVGGSALGFASGKYIQKRHGKSTDMEMTQLSNQNRQTVEEETKGENSLNWQSLNPFK